MTSIAQYKVIGDFQYINRRHYIMYRDKKTSQAIGHGIVTILKVIGIIIALPIYILLELSKMQK